jgi:hypothetical protein
MGPWFWLSVGSGLGRKVLPAYLRLREVDTAARAAPPAASRASVEGSGIAWGASPGSKLAEVSMYPLSVVEDKADPTEETCSSA